MRDAAERLGTTVPADTFGRDAHGLLVAVYQDTRLPIEVRFDAAKVAIRFELPRLRATVAVVRHRLAEMTNEWVDGRRLMVGR